MGGAGAIPEKRRGETCVRMCGRALQSEERAADQVFSGGGLAGGASTLLPSYCAALLAAQETWLPVMILCEKEPWSVIDL